MKNSKNKLMLGLIGLACVACCAIPIAGIAFAGAGSAAIGAYFASGALRELLVCGVPILLIIVGFFLYSRHKAACCADPKSNCTSNQCGVKPKE
jgi:hypothetical protein